MTIQRQYSLPNCTLVLEGLGDTGVNPAEVRPLMSILLNAECHLAGQEKPLAGGREFFESLVAAVSQYGQEIFSGIHAVTAGPTNSWIQFKRLDMNHHRLTVRPPEAPPDSGIATQLTRELALTTVQLFDLVEAVDQFLADSQTLPSISVKLQSVPKRYVRREESLTKRAVAPTVGASGLAIAAIAFFTLPVPKVNQPTCLKLSPECTSKAATQNPASPGASPSPTATASSTATPGAASPSPTASSATASPSPTATASPDLTNLESVLNTAPEITDPAELDSLGKKLRTQLDDAWKNRTPTTQDLVYRLGVAKDGSIVGYKPVNPAALTNAKQTPLLDLLYRPATGSQPSAEPIAQFKVVFTTSGVVEVAPWRESMASPQAGGTEITDSKQLEDLLPKLKQQIVEGWGSTTPKFEKDLIFRVRVKPDGSIADYRPENQPAYDYGQQTPLSKLGKLADDGAVTSQEPYALFKVVFRAPSGRLEISPWRGWQ